MQYIITSVIIYIYVTFSLNASDSSLYKFFIENEEVASGSSASISSGNCIVDSRKKQQVVFKQFFTKIDKTFIQKEFDLLQTLFRLGALVPKPYCLEKKNETSWQIIMEHTGLSLSCVDLSVRNISFRHDLVLGIIDALESVHNNGYVHGDLSPNNITINKTGFIQLKDKSCFLAPKHLEKGSVKLIDFGNSYRHGEHYTLFSTTPLYGAPERYGEDNDDSEGYIAYQASDIFSLAVLVFKLHFTTGQPGVLSLIERIARKKITSQYVLIGYMATSYTKDYEKELKQRRTFTTYDPLAKLLCLSVHPNPSKRPTIREFREGYVQSLLTRKRNL